MAAVAACWATIGPSVQLGCRMHIVQQSLRGSVVPVRGSVGIYMIRPGS
jgi:hypothetical protein